MGLGCQMREPFAIAVSGVAGSGKSTLGRGLARQLNAPLLDLDTLTNPLLDALGDVVFGEHWLSSTQAPLIRRGRYAALLATASEVLRTAGGVVLVAPFTAELAGGDAWQSLVEALTPTPVRMVRLVGSEELFAARRAARGTERDLHRPTGPGAVATVPVVPVSAELSTEAQLAQLLVDLGLDGRAPSGRPGG